MKKSKFIIYAAFAMLFMGACNSKKTGNDIYQSDVEDVEASDSLRPDSLHHPSPDEFDEGHMPPPPPDGRGFDGPPPPPPHGKGHHKPDRSATKGDACQSKNMRGSDPASEDDMDDNGMSRYMENNDEEGWD